MIPTYRNWVQDQDLTSVTVRVEESDLFIRADKRLDAQARQYLRYLRSLIQDYIRRDPEFASSLEPHSVGPEAAGIVREMSRASFSAGVGPMAAVAGAIAEHLGRELLKYSTQVIVENGGDIFIKTDRPRKVAIFAGASCYSGKLALQISPSRQYWGICTSSGTVGPSLSFGRADAVVVICNSAILADAWATRLANMVKSVSNVEKVLSFAKDIAEIKGTIVIIGEKIGARGEVELVKT